MLFCPASVADCPLRSVLLPGTVPTTKEERNELWLVSRPLAEEMGKRNMQHHAYDLAWTSEPRFMSISTHMEASNRFNNQYSWLFRNYCGGGGFHAILYLKMSPASPAYTDPFCHAFQKHHFRLPMRRATVGFKAPTFKIQKKLLNSCYIHILRMFISIFCTSWSSVIRLSLQSKPTLLHTREILTLEKWTWID